MFSIGYGSDLWDLCRARGNDGESVIDGVLAGFS
jgi:hypothetical protein